MALSTTGVTGMLVQGENAHNCTIMFDGLKKEFIVVDNHDGGIVKYDTTFAVWITQRRFVRAFKALVGKAPTTLTRVKLDPLMVAELKKVKGKFEIYDHEAFINKMDKPRAKQILATFEAQEAFAAA